MSKKILILFSILSFFIFIDSVNAASLDSLRESYTNVLMTSCTYLGDENDGSCGTLDTDDNPITNKTFRDVLDIVGITHSYFVEMRGYDFDNNEISDEYDYIYLFNIPVKIGRFTQKFGGAKYYDDYYYFAPNINSTDSCYIFQYLPSETESYDHMKMYYSSNCITDRDALITDGDSLTGRYIYRPYVSYVCPNGNDDTSTCYKDHDFIIKVTNFDLYDFEDNLYQDSNVKDDIVVPEETINKEISTGIWGTLKEIFISIVELPSRIINGLSSFFEMLLDGILDGLVSLFIPSEDFYSSYFQATYKFICQQLGFLVYPIEIVFDFADRFYNLSDTNSAIFKIPKLEIFEHTLYEGTEFDLMSIVNSNDSFKYIYSIYKIVVSALIVFWLVNLAVKKEDEIFGSGGGLK